MGARTRHSFLALLACSSFTLAAQKQFRVHDDVLAYPQFEVLFPDEYILEAEARSLLSRTPQSRPSEPDTTQSSTFPSSSSSSSIETRRESPDQIPIHNDGAEGDGHRTAKDEKSLVEYYEEMVLHGQRYLCAIPRVNAQNDTAHSGNDPADREKELARATDRGMELLREMEGRCMYYSAGWWSYSFCYMNQVRQFHAALPGNGVPAYPPAEDPLTHSYVLGRYHRDDRRSNSNDNDVSDDDEKHDTRKTKKTSTEIVVRESRGDSRYLVQYLGDGTTCDIIGKERKIEVQFHCHPQSTDRIGWIKEVNTCSYLMAVYTPRLCNDVAFQPPREDQPHDIICREIIRPGDVELWEAERNAQLQAEQELLDSGAKETTPAYPIVGGIQVGAKKLVGKDGKVIEKGKVASAGEEKAELIARSLRGKYQQLSKEQLKKLKIDPQEIESARQELEDYAQGKDWKLEVINVNGERGLRGIIIEPASNGEQTKPGKEQQEEQQEGKKKKTKKSSAGKDRDSHGESDQNSEPGSDETYKDEL